MDVGGCWCIDVHDAERILNGAVHEGHVAHGGRTTVRGLQQQVVISLCRQGHNCCAPDIAQPSRNAKAYAGDVSVRKICFL